MKRSSRGSMIGAISLLLTMTACATEKEYSFGTCKEYKPLFCLAGSQQCRTDSNGCQSCTCVGGERPFK